MADNFRLAYIGSAKKQVRELFLRAKELGLDARFLEAAQEIERWLRSAPRQFGDPCYSFHALKLDVFMRVFPPFVVYYAVHQTEHVVFVRSMEALPGGELEG